MLKRLLLLTLMTLANLQALSGQGSNTNCSSALHIENPVNFCSASSEFSTVNAGGSGLPALDCFQGVQNDLYFSFTAVAQAVNILVNGEVGGSLKAPRILLYAGGCEDSDLSILNCQQSMNGNDLVNMLETKLVIGKQYLIRVGGAGGNQGSFQLCINNYNQPIEPGQDFEDAAVLCDKSSFVIQTLSGGGDNPNEANGTCLDVGFANSETQSSWTSWIAANDGTLTFNITPLNYGDDIDFVLYELPNGIDDFASRIVVRCMAAGCAGGGPTGLDDSSTDVEEPPGCPNGNDNFLRALDMTAGTAYALLINNFTQTGAGVSLSFGGSGEFLSPDPNFSIVVDDIENPLTGLVCDKVFQVENTSDTDLVGIFAYEWNFGEDAIPQTAAGEGPFNVEYPTFGKKYIALTVSSDLGCKITEVREVDVEPCCPNPENVSIELIDKLNIGCIANELGFLEVQGLGGLPTYSYRINGGDYSSEAKFENLLAGDYEVGVIDRKGCEVSRAISILEVAPNEVDAGPDASVEYLGDSIQLDGSYFSNNVYDFFWEPSETMRCTDGTDNCLDPVVVPLGNTTFTLNIIDFEACNVSDEVVITVSKIRPLFAPNVFSPNEDGYNDVFALNGNASSISSILEFHIYDRWGNLVYTARNIAPNDLSQSWDGRLNGEIMDAGVYIWYARLVYIDPNKPTEVISGDVTLIR